MIAFARHLRVPTNFSLMIACDRRPRSVSICFASAKQLQPDDRLRRDRLSGKPARARVPTNFSLMIACDTNGAPLRRWWAGANELQPDDRLRPALTTLGELPAACQRTSA